MRPSENIEKLIKLCKPEVKAGDQMDKLTLNDSFAVMDETIGRKSFKFSMFALLRNRFAISTIVTAIIMIAGLLLFQPEPNDKTDIPKITNVTQTPGEMMSLLSINLAYNRGGLDEVEKQYEKAVTKKSQQSKQITITELLAESNGT